MKRYLIEQSSVTTRDWQQIDSGLVAATLGAERLDIRSDGAVVEDGIVLIHRHALGPVADMRCLQSVCTPNLTLIVVSGSSQVEGEVIRGQLYCRQTPVDIPVDPVFAGCWRTFLASRRRGKIDFGLLEPPCVDTVVALQLLADLAKAMIQTGHARKPAELGWWLRGVAAESEQQLLQRLNNEVGLTTAASVVDAVKDVCSDLDASIGEFATYIATVVLEHRARSLPLDRIERDE
jgi:hypothetical protein